MKSLSYIFSQSSLVDEGLINQAYDQLYRPLFRTINEMCRSVWGDHLFETTETIVEQTKQEVGHGILE